MAKFSPEGFSDTESSFLVSSDKSTNIILTFYLLGTKTTVKATTRTRVYEYRGLTRESAKTMEASDDYNYNDKTDARFVTAAGAWLNVPDANGGECRCSARRINEADMWRAIVTHSSTTVQTPSGWQVRS